ncbi:MAG: FtsX-like permease family protein [Burkholderiales bacterium]
MIGAVTSRAGWVALVFGPLRQSPGRLTIAVVAIALGVALGLAVQLVNGTALAEFERAARQVSGDADLSIRGTRPGFDESLYAELARRPEVAVASPLVEVHARVPGLEGSLRVLGIDRFRAGQLQSGLIAPAADAADLLSDDVLFVSRAVLTATGRRVGDRLPVQAGLDVIELRIGGVLPSGSEGARLAVMDIAAVQSRFQRLGRLTRVDLRLVPGTDRDRFAASVRLPAGVTIETPDRAGEMTARMTRSYRVNLNVLALVALFTGALLVSSTQALSVARRRSALALLRVLGMTRWQVAALVLAEGAIVGVTGALLGAIGGIALAQAVLAFVGADLGAGVFAETSPGVVVTGGPVVLFATLGLAAALLGGLGPALEAARAEPAIALKSGDDARAFAALASPLPGSLLLAAAVLCVPLPPLGGLPLFGYVAIGALLLGTILLLPRLTRLLIQRVPTPRRSIEASLASARLAAYPTHAAASLAAIVAAVSLSVAMAIMVTSFRHSLVDWLEGILPADLYVRAGGDGDTGFIDPEAQQRMAGVPGVRRIEFLRWQQVVLDPRRAPVTLMARDGVDANAETRLPSVGNVVRAPAGVPAAWISESAAAIFQLEPGSRLTLPLAGRPTEFHVAGVWRDYARPAGAVLIDRSVYVAETGDRLANDLGVWAKSTSALSGVRDALRAYSPAGLELLSPGDIKARSLAIFDRTFAVTYALEGIAVLIGLLGLSSAIGSEVTARRREFGMLRHLGIARGQIARMLAFEGVTVTAVGLVLGAVLGTAMSLILIHVVNRQSFHWGMSFHVPWLPLAAFFGAMLLASAVTAVVSGRQVMGRDIVRAVREDW